MSDGAKLRPRKARQAAATSDERRFRGLWLAAAIAALVVALVAVAGSAPAARRGAPGPLDRPHRLAGVTCAGCHQGEQLTCTACHGAHPSSTRAGHRQACASCHPSHEGGGVAFVPGGQALRYGPGAEVGVSSPFRSARAVTVPLVPARACAGCHDLDAPRDPIAACLLADQARLGGARPTVCFDEHRQAGGPRDAAWEAARQVASVAPLTPAAPRSRTAPWLWLALGSAAGLLVWGAARGRPERAPPPAAPVAAAVRRLPVINPATCIGCHACADACPFDVIEIKRYVAQVVRPQACCGLTACADRCPNGSLVMGDGAAQPVLVPPPGVLLAGDVTGLPLIRNAIQHGRQAIAAIERGGDGLDVIIVGAGPAGLAAALEAKARGLRYLVLEQGQIGQSIQSFPRGKLVLDQGQADTGPLWLEECTKEELLARWLPLVRRERLAIREGVRVTAIEREGTGFVVHAGDERLHARQVLLAIGQRGTPRELPLPVPPAMAAHVHYHLADARSFAGQRVVVVGMGDVAMETAVALSRQPGTRVAMVHRGDSFTRGSRRNIEAVEQRVAAGAIEVFWKSELTAIHPGQIQLGSTHVPCQALFVLIGSIPPHELLRSAGVAKEIPQ